MVVVVASLAGDVAESELRPRVHRLHQATSAAIVHRLHMAVAVASLAGGVSEWREGPECIACTRSLS